VTDRPVLWHIPVSHYNEKVRWALAWKGVEHERRAPPPGAHMAVALWLTRGAHKTFPVLTLDGRSIGDSTAIIAALEERWPEPPLYPADPGERRRALELEELFDEELGPQMRLLVWHEFTSGGEGPDLGPVAAASLPSALRRFGAVRTLATAGASGFVKLRFSVADADRAAEARLKIAAAMDRLELELGDREYLAGDTFTVADLTAASLFYPIALPPEGPQLITDVPPALEEFFAQFRDRRGYAYVEEMFARHRAGAPAPQPA
jgi:glutathione S-transferase